MRVSIEDLHTIASSVWELMMNSTITPTDPDEVAPTAAPAMAYVELEGAFDGKVALQLSPASLTKAACEMFAISPEEVTEAQLEDVTKELANMVGGNIKCLVEQPTRLSIPQLTEPQTWFAHNPRPATQMAFEDDGQPIKISVYEKTTGTLDLVP